MPKLLVIKCPLFLLLHALQFSNVLTTKDFQSPPTVRLVGNITIGGVFSIRTEVNQGVCQQYDVAGLLRVEAMMYAIDLINREGGIEGPNGDNIFLGYLIVDDCNSIDKALEASMSLMMGKCVSEKKDWLSNYETSQTGFCRISLTINNDNNYNRLTFIAESRDGNDSTGEPWRTSPVMAIIGADSSDVSAAVASVLAINMMPLISYASVSQELSDKSSYPSFLRTVPSDVIQMRAIVDLLKYFNWTWVSVIATDDSYGRRGLQGLQEAIDTPESEICIATEQLIDVDLESSSVMTAFTKIMAETKATVVILICSSPRVSQVFKIAQKLNVTGKIFIASGWGNSNLPGEIEPVIRGTIGLVPDDVVECGFLLYLLKLVTESPSVIQEKHPWIYGYLLESGLNGTNRSDLAGLFGLHPSFKLTSVDRQTCAELTHTAYNPTWFSQAAPVIDAVNAIAAGLRSFDWNTEQPLPLTLLQYLHKISYQTTGKTVRFDPNGDIYNGYRITVPQLLIGDRIRFISVGNWSKNGLELDLNAILSTWPNATVPISTCRRECQPGTYRIYSSMSCCWTCVECPNGTVAVSCDQLQCELCGRNQEPNADKTNCVAIKANQLKWTDYQSITILSFCTLGLCLTMGTIIVFVVYRATPVVRCGNCPLLFIMLIMIGLAFSLPVSYLVTPTEVGCSIENLEFGVIFSTIIGIFLVKTWHVHRIFTAALHKILAMTSKPSGRQEIWISFIFPTVFCIIAIPYIVTNVPQPDVTAGDCGSDWNTLQIISMGYIIILSTATTLVAYRARKLPQNYNESRHICSIMMILVLIWVTSLPSYYSVSSDSKVTILSVTDLAAAYAILLLMFGPKLHLIFFTPKKNSFAYVRRQQWLYTLTQGSWRTLTPKNSTEVPERKSQSSETSFGPEGCTVLQVNGTKRPQLSDIIPNGEPSSEPAVLTGFRRRAATFENLMKPLDFSL